MLCRVWVETREGNNRLEDLGVDGRIMLKLILQKIIGSCGLDTSGSGYESVATAMNLRITQNARNVLPS